MKTIIIHGQSHEGSTCHAARMLADKIGGEHKEVFLPRDFGEFCTGCCNCFLRSEELCPHFKAIAPIVEAIDEADVIIMASPVYAMRATGPMKAFLDHMAYRFMIHRPYGPMFMKQGVCLSTTAGAGTRSAMKDMATSLFWWGVGKIYRKGFTLRSVSWQHVPEEKRQKIDRSLTKLAAKIRRRAGRVRPGLRTKLVFNVARALRRVFPKDADREYWDAMGWTGSGRPWHSKAPG